LALDSPPAHGEPDADAIRAMTTAAGAFRREHTSGKYLSGLVWTLIRTDFKTRYHGTIQGFAWALLKPLTMFFVLMGVFSFIFASDTGYRVNLIIGLFLWDFFAQGTAVGLVSLQAKGYLLAKAAFPSWIIVVTSISNAAVTLGVFCLIILATLGSSGHLPSPFAVLLFFWYLLHFAGLVIGFSLAASVLFLRYRDLNQVWDVVLQAGFFVAPIIYPLSILPERLHKYLYLWPPTPIIQFARAVLTTGIPPTTKAHVLLTGEVGFVLLVGIVIFRHYAPRAAEYL
jgi:ABC-type polysaccharide/polyol phosphate export permease